MPHVGLASSSNSSSSKVLGGLGWRGNQFLFHKLDNAPPSFGMYVLLSVFGICGGGLLVTCAGHFGVIEICKLAVNWLL